MIYSIQYLRGIASLLVLLAHVSVKGQQYGEGVWGYWGIGLIGVDLFFVISGFIISLVIDRGEKDPFVFAKKRFFRVMPLYWALSFCALLVYLIMPERVNVSGSYTDIWASFLLLPSQGYLLIQNGWTLSYEMFFYLIFFIVLLLPVKRVFITTSVFLLAIAALGQIKTSNLYFNFFTDSIILEFFAGLLVYQLWKSYKIPRSVSALLILLGMSWLISQELGWFEIGARSRFVNVGIPVSLLVVGVLRFEESLKKHPSKILMMLGNSSYSLYLSHPFVLGGSALLYSTLQVKGSAYEHLFLSGSFLLSIIGGYLCYKFLEQPLLRTTSKRT